jgi:thiamine biosynthesis lipoprotein
VTVLAPPRPGAGALSDAASKPLFIAGVAGWKEAAEGLGIRQALLIDDAGELHVTPDLLRRLRSVY